MAASLFLCTQSFTKENIVKFLIREKETGNRDCKKHREQKSYMACGKADLTLPSHDFVHGTELWLGLFKCISLIVEAGSLRGCKQAKQIILAMNMLLLLLLFSPLGQFSHSALSTDSRL